LAALHLNKTARANALKMQPIKLSKKDIPPIADSSNINVENAINNIGLSKPIIPKCLIFGFLVEL